MSAISFLKNLVCPVCRSPLETDKTAFFCTSCGEHFSEFSGVPVLLAGENQDIWKENENGIVAYFQEHPETAAALKNTPEEELGGADLTLKAFLLRQQGEEEECLRLWELSFEKNYPEAYRRSFQEQVNFICRSLSDTSGPILDFASGRGMLLSHLLKKCKAPLLASDLSPTTLQDLHRRFSEYTAAKKLFTMAFDAKAIPFADGSLPYLTTCLGLQNIPQPEKAIRELRRVCGKTFFAMCIFFPDGDRENQNAAAQFGLGGAYSRKQLTALLEKAGWSVTAHDSPEFSLPSTPESRFLKGMRVDSLPVTKTNALFSTLVCKAVS